MKKLILSAMIVLGAFALTACGPGTTDNDAGTTGDAGATDDGDAGS